MQRPNIYTFHEYKKYLKAMIQYQKSLKISLRSLSKSIGVSAAYLTMITNNKRNFDLKYLESFANSISLNNQEKNFFKNLVILNDSDKDKERSEAYKKLSRFKEFKALNSEELISYKYLNKWYYVAIRELSFHPDFIEDAAWIQKRLKTNLTQREIKKAIEFLKKNNLIGENSDPGHLNCSDGVYKLSLSKFHGQMLDQVKESIKSTPREERKILGFTKSMSKEEFLEAKAILNEALEKIQNIGGDKAKDEIYHFYFMGIPLTEGENNE